MNIPYVMRKCTKCGEWKVASTINFHKNKGCKYGVKNECKKCFSKYRKQHYEANKEKVLEQCKQYYEANKEKVNERNKRYYEANKEKVLEQCKQYYEANKDKMVEYRKQYCEANKDKKAEYDKQYRENNKDKIAKKNKRYYEANRDKILEQNKQYYKNNKDKHAEYYKQYNQTPQGQASRFNRSHRRRIKEEEQGTGITKDQWLEMMKFFDFRCAYSGEYIGSNSFNRTIDHIVPLNSGGDNMIWNCVPMTRSLNSSKRDKDMLDWYKEQECYDPNRLQKIYDWQEHAYNKWGKNTEYFNTNDIQIKLL